MTHSNRLSFTKVGEESIENIGINHDGDYIRPSKASSSFHAAARHKP
jgi:hypothetical protein